LPVDVPVCEDVYTVPATAFSIQLGLGLFWIRSYPAGAATPGFPSAANPKTTSVVGLVVENVTAHPSRRLQSLKSVLGRLGLVSNGATVFAPITL